MGSSADYSILVQVTFDESEIQKRLNTIASRLNLKINADDSALQEAVENTSRLSDGAEDVGLRFHEANMIMQQSLEIIESMVDQVYELDSAITDFKKVSDLRGSGLEAYVSELADMGAEVARTGKPNRSGPECWDGKPALRTVQNPVTPKAFEPQRKDEICLLVMVGNY